MKRRDMLRLSLIGAAGLPFLGRSTSLGASANVRNEQGFRFVHMTDIHLRSENRAEEGFLKAVEAVNSLDPCPDFVVTGGDLVSDALAVSYEQAVKLFDMYERCISRLKMPAWHVIGNHDIFGWYPWSGVPASHPEFGKEMFRKRLGNGSTWSSFDHKGWHFILLDSIEWDPLRTDYYGVISDEQIEWLKSDLASIDGSTPIALATHIPFVSVLEQIRSGGNAGLSAGGAVSNTDAVLRMFSGKNLKLVLQGHLHRDEQVRFEDKSFIMSGAVCAAWWRGPHGRTEEGFGVIDVSGDDFSYSYYDYGWEV
ncbi:MAG: metallophosphoesterase [Gemmatimonadota bacterium]|nr:metallophosphoesterase [Gemmatimonadota bacterium]